MLLKYVWFGQGIFITITREHFVINAFENSGNSKGFYVLKHIGFYIHYYLFMYT